jgi:hypothetical protein
MSRITNVGRASLVLVLVRVDLSQAQDSETFPEAAFDEIASGSERAG